MDLASASALTAAVGAAATSAGSEAGRQAWDALVSLARRAVGRSGAVTEGEPDEDLPADPADGEQVRVLTGRLVALAESDPHLLQELESWARRYDIALTSDHSSVTNTVSGNARVQGPVIQGRDFQGPITFGS